MLHFRSLIRILNHLHPNISMHILPTALSISLNVLRRRIVSQSRASPVGDHFLYSQNLNL